jgi:phosphoglycolate phosphatase
VVFDLDGTLIDSRRDIVEAANHALGRHGFEALPPREIETYVGDGARLLLSRAARVSEDDQRLPELLSAFLDYYTRHPLDHTTLMPGASAALRALSEFPLAICTNKPRVTSERVLDGLGLAPLFQVLAAGDDLPQRKPDPAPIFHIAGALGLAPEELVVVGDGAQDVLAGKRAGARTVGLEGGIQPIERLLAAAPDVLLPSLAELPPLVRSWASL